MIKGSITLEDTVISFENNDENQVCFSVLDTSQQIFEEFTVPQDKFFKALAIAVHNDGMPDYQADYEDAASIQGVIRWIP